ncbi:MAG TPA: hypothetical protein VIG88_12575, partial [Lysobacter sp.]
MRRRVPVNALVGILLTVGLAACDRAPAPVEAPRPALVVRAMPAATAATAFAGEIRAREEAALSFRVGGNVVERRVDVGDRV